MGICGDSPYEMVDFYQLNDLKNGQLYRAEIDAIDRTANTADITLLDECSSPASLMDVPFFYHCETSTGTLEDLERGNEAFVVGDWVYVMFAPAVGEDAARFYIIGHVDIRGTKRCSKGEYIVIVMGPYWGEWVVIYDTASFSMLDLASFESLPGSPSPPAAFPCERTPSFLSWLSFNFETATPAAEIPHTAVVQTTSESGLTSTVLSLSSNHASQPSPPGYHYESLQDTWLSHPDSYSNSSYTGDYTQYESNYYYRFICTASFEKHFVGRHKWRIFDDVIDDYIYVKSVIDETLELSGSSTPKTTPSDRSFDQYISIQSSASAYLVSGTAQFDYGLLNKSETGSQTWEFIYGGTSTKNCTGNVVIAPTLWAWGNVYCIGAYGFYSIFGGMLDTPIVPITTTGTRAHLLDYVHYSIIDEWNLFMIWGEIDPVYSAFPMPIVTIFAESPEIDITNPVSVQECISNNSRAQSIGIANSCKILAEHILTTHGIETAKYGPSLMEAYAKKQGE